MRAFAICALITVATSVVSCNGGSDKSQSEAKGVILLADLHCEAVQLRKARFELADRMRFIQDTIMANVDTNIIAGLNGKLKKLEPYKDSIVGRSLELSKVISAKLDSVLIAEFSEEGGHDRFDSLLTAELKRRGCE